MPLLDAKHLRSPAPNQAHPRFPFPNDDVRRLLRNLQCSSFPLTARMSGLRSFSSDAMQVENALALAKDNNKLPQPKALGENLRAQQQKMHQGPTHGAALSDTPSSTAPNSPMM